jgi:tetratricopeptide (TPR) repeat protein
MKRLLIILLLLSTSAPHIIAQGSRQALLADSLYRYSSYAKAIRHYEKAIRKEESPELLLGLANSHYKLQEYSRAIDIYKQVDKQNTAWKVQDKINYIESLRIMGEDDQMDRLLEQWNTIPESKESVYKNSLQAMDLFYMDSAVYNVKAAEMNSEYSEFSPVYYGDGILFASSRSEGNTSNKKYHWNQENYLDLYYAEENDSTVRSFSVNTKFHDGPVAFYNGGKNVIFTRNEDVSKRKDQKQLGLYHADVSASGSWENIEPLALNHPDYSVSHPGVSADGSKLYFVSNMPGGFGGTDIYVASRNGDQWTDPKNLGPDINTSGNEMFPAIFGEELFFASDGHPGLGGLDIFITEKLEEDSYFVRNAGYPLNSTWDDFSLVTRDGRNGYFATNRNGNDDLFAFTKDKIIVEITYIDPEENILDSVVTDFNGRSIPQGRDKMTRIYMDRESINELKAFKTAFADTTYEIQTHDEFFISKTIQLRPLTDEDILRGTVDIYPIAVNNTDYDLFMGQEEKLLRADEGNKWK